MREGWEYKKLGEVCKVTMGQSPDGNSVNASNGIEFHQGKVFFGEKFLNVSNIYTEQPSKIANPNSVLLCVRAPVGTVNITPRRICIGRGLCAIQPNDIINMPFLFYALTQKQAYFDKNSTGSTFKAISSNVVTNTVIPVPPLSEQQRIVSELDLLSSIIEKKKVQLKEYDQLAQSIFYDMFGDPVTNEKGWEVKKLGEVCYIGLGFTHTPTYVDKGVPFLSVKDITGGEIDFSDIKYVSENEYMNAPKGAKPQKGDILFCRVGTMGKPVIIKTDVHFCTFVSLGYLSILYNRLNNIYIKYWMLSDGFNSQVEANVRGLAIKNLNTGWLKMFNIPLPPLPLQQSFASKIEAIERQKALIQQSIAEVQMLFDSRMDDWFA